ncbi:acyl carrier protein [Leptospira alstonii]|uniref:acyl carrier protein n=1 Tax=Leptospira alstonii TaxID=28452 RepID=UPI00077378D8|nr:acyl carrier protein [Leptospira alstonii]
MERILQIISDVFEADISILPKNFVIRDLEKWDSFNHISMIIAVENEYKVSFTPKEVESIHSIEELLTILNSKK